MQIPESRGTISALVALLFGAPRQFFFFFLVLVAFVLISGNARPTHAAIQEKETKNPYAGDPKAVLQGEAAFRKACAACHGNDAHGGPRGPDLISGRWSHGSSDAAIYRTMTRGVPGTPMPAARLSDEEVWMVIAYLRSLSVESSPLVAGNREAGERIFLGEGLCSKCHMVNGKGGRLGPDLSRIGIARPVAYLIESIREPSKYLAELDTVTVHSSVPRVYDTVTAVTRDGRRITGIARNEDTFSLQLIDQQEEFHFFLKKDLKEVTHEHKSLMPAYSEQILNAEKLQDLIAYLSSLRGN